jgi:hypothetical protein
MPIGRELKPLAMKRLAVTPLHRIKVTLMNLAGRLDWIPKTAKNFTRLKNAWLKEITTDGSSTGVRLIASLSIETDENRSLIMGLRGTIGERSQQRFEKGGMKWVFVLASRHLRSVELQCIYWIPIVGDGDAL